MRKYIQRPTDTHQRYWKPQYNSFGYVHFYTFNYLDGYRRTSTRRVNSIHCIQVEHCLKQCAHCFVIIFNQNVIQFWDVITLKCSNGLVNGWEVHTTHIHCMYRRFSIQVYNAQWQFGPDFKFLSVRKFNVYQFVFGPLILRKYCYILVVWFFRTKPYYSYSIRNVENVYIFFRSVVLFQHSIYRK